MKLLGFTGSMLAGLLGLAMGAFYLWMMSGWAELGEWRPGTPTMVGVGLFAALFVFGGVRRILNGFKQVVLPPRAKCAAVASDRDDADSDFDLDAALARYMANRSAAEPLPSTPSGRPGGFGRRGL